MQTQSLFKKEMQKATMESGVAGFVTYMVIFVFGIILSVAVSVAETFFFNGENLWLAISLFYGALLLIAMAVQMYLIGNKNASTIDEIYIQIASRSMLICDKKCRAEQNKKDVLATRKDEQIEKTSSVINKEKPIDSIDELRILVASLIERGASKELLDFLKNSLKSVAQTEYASYVDNLRIKNIIQKLEDYCVSGLKSC